MVISISGPAGSGKTTIAKLVAQKYTLEYVCAGKMIRAMAEKKRMSVYDFNSYVDEHPEIDREVDETIVWKAREGNVVLEGRLTGWMMHTHDIPALKLYFKIDPRIAAERVAQREKISTSEAMRYNEQREKDHWKRFEKLYGVSGDDRGMYDVIIDSGTKNIAGVMEEVSGAIDHYREHTQAAPS